MGQAALRVQRQPGGVFLILGDAKTEFARMADGGTVDAAWPHLQDVDQREADGAADHGGSAITVAERVERAGGTEFATDWAVEHDEHRAAAGGGGGAVQQEVGLQHGGDGGDHSGEVHRQAASHDGIDRKLLRGDRHASDWLDADKLIGRHHCPVEARAYSFRGGRHDRQAIGPAVGMVQLLRRVDVVDRVGAGGELHGGPSVHLTGEP